MPRKPTLLARQVKKELIQLVAQLPSDSPIPTMRELGKAFAFHPSTMFRMLRDLSLEGVVWQSPGGRFFPLAARKKNLKGVPVCFIGRETWQWSRLYQEILEGVSEACSANESPLLLLSAPSLVKQSNPTEPPDFATSRIQQKELAALLATAPRGCAGFILDHLWQEEPLSTAAFPGGERVQLLCGRGRHAQVFSPDYHAGAQLVRQYLQSHFDEGVLVIPFDGDSAIYASLQALREELRDFPLREIPFSGMEGEMKSLKSSHPKKRTCLLCPEDNIALVVFDHLQKFFPAGKRPGLIATQGTGRIDTPIIRLRYDYRQIGRSSVARILHGEEYKPAPPFYDSVEFTSDGTICIF